MDEEVPEEVLRQKPEEPLEHVGYFSERIVWTDGDLERILAFGWLEMNRRYRGDCFLDLLLNNEGHDESQETTQRDARVAATVVQWFGSNCGFGFMVDCLRKAGYQVSEQPK